jgi:oligosaccharide repeat unit polymerase
MIEIAGKLLAIIFSFFILGQAYLIRRAVGTYIFPACLLSLVWFIFTFIPLILLFDVPVNPFSVLYIFICVLAFSLSALPFNWSRAFEVNKLKSFHDYAQFSSRLMHYFFYISIISSLVFSTLSVISSDIKLHSIIFNLVETSGYYASLRGQGTSEYGVWGVLGIFFTYATPILGALISEQHQKGIKKLMLSFVTFVPTIYVMLTQSAKLIFYFSIGYYIAAVLLKKIYLNRLNLFSRVFILRSIAFVLLMFPVLSISFLSRNVNYELEGEELLSVLLFSMKSYAFAQIYAFSDYFSFYLGTKSELIYIHDFNSYGYWTFKSIFDMFGGEKYFPPTFFPDSYYHGEVIATNIFTIFRSLINDFGGVGAIYFMFACGLVVHVLFYRLLTSRSAWAACSAFMVSVVFILGTYLLSIFVARWSILLLVAFTIIFWINNRYCKSHHPGFDSGR